MPVYMLCICPYECCFIVSLLCYSAAKNFSNRFPLHMKCCQMKHNGRLMIMKGVSVVSTFRFHLPNQRISGLSPLGLLHPRVFEPVLLLTCDFCADTVVEYSV